MVADSPKQFGLKFDKSEPLMIAISVSGLWCEFMQMLFEAETKNCPAMSAELMMVIVMLAMMKMKHVIAQPYVRRASSCRV